MISLAAAKDMGTYVLTVSFADEDGAAVVPTAVVWSLYDGAGAVVNDRSDVSAIPAAATTIVLTGADLSASAGAGTAKQQRTRKFVVKATYDSIIDSVPYVGLPANEEARWLVEDITGV